MVAFDVEPERELPFDFSQIPAHVEKVHIDGVQRTNDKFIKQQVTDVFKARTFEELLYYVAATKKRLMQLDIFHEVEPLVDLYHGRSHTGSLNEEWAPAQGLDNKHRYCITFRVRERKRFQVRATTSCDMENNVQLVLVSSLTNLFGRGAKLEVDYETGVLGKVGSQTLSLTAPLSAAKSWIKWGVGVWNNVSDCVWARFLDQGRGIYGDLRFPTVAGFHQLRLESLWRTITAADLSTPNAIRECSGEYLKPSIRHILERDTRDDRVLPLRGTYLRSTTELAGIPMIASSYISPGPNTVCHVKQECEAGFNLPLSPWLFSHDFIDKWGIALQSTLGVGIAHSQRPDSSQINIGDRFFVGGPLTLRGFETRSMGPRVGEDSENGRNSAALGSDAYYLAAIHLYSALPYFGRRYNSITDAVRLHAFANVGNAQILSSRPDPQRWLSENRLSWGIGLAFRLMGMARIELNYCFPLKAQAGDRVTPGFQFGFGLNYL